MKTTPATILAVAVLMATATSALAVAVEDYLSSWLIKQKPSEAMPYYAGTSYACITDLEPEALNTDMASFRILRDMEEVNESMGKVKSLEEAVESVDPGNSRLKPIKNPHSALFTLTRIPKELVEDMECRYADELIALKHNESTKDHFAAAMKLKNDSGVELYQVWAKQEGYWKIVASHLQPFADTPEVPDTKSRVSQERRPEPLVVDPSLVARVEEFMDAWFIHQDETAALSYFSEKSYDCVGLFDDASQPPVTDARTRLQHDLKSISDFVGKPSSLEEGLSAKNPWEQDLHLIAHEQQNAYALTSYSSYHAEQLECWHRKEGREYHGKKPRTHGGYFSVSFQTNRGGESSPILTLVWAKEKKEWEIVSLDIEKH